MKRRKDERAPGEPRCGLGNPRRPRHPLHLYGLGIDHRGHQRLPPPLGRIGQVIPSRIDPRLHLRLIPQRIPARHMRDRPDPPRLLGHIMCPFQRARLPRVPLDLRLAALGPHQIPHEHRETGGDDERAHRGNQVQPVPAKPCRIGIDPPRHPPQPGQVHRQEGQVEAAEDQPERPAPQPLRQLLLLDEREEVIDPRDHRKDHTPEQRVMQVRHHEIRVMRLEIERRQRQHHTRQPAHGEDRQGACDPQHRQRHLHPPHHERGQEREDLHPCRDHHRLGRRREEPKRDRWQAGGEHVMHPQPEAQEPGAHRRQHDPRIAHDRPPRDRRNDHRGNGDRRQEDDVDLRMPEDPEQVLPQHRVAAPLGVEEGPVETPLQLEQEIPRDKRRKGEQDHPAHHHHVPRV